MTVDQIAGNKLLQSASREDRSESGFPQYVRNFVSLLSLNFDIASLDGASAAACFLHFFGQCFFFRGSNAFKIGNNGNRLSTPVCF